jgi:hypothetical protein
MSLKIGDSAFQSNGRVSIIRNIDPISGQLELDQSREATTTELRHGYLNGLSEDERKVFNDTLDAVRGSEQTEEKVKMMSESIESLRQDPKNYRIVQYLQSQMSHIIQSEGYRPKIYSVPASSVE